MHSYSFTLSYGFCIPAVTSLLLLLMTSSTPCLGDEFNCTETFFPFPRNTTISKIDCTNSSFTRIPSVWPASLEHLIVTNNVVELGVLGALNYTALVTLHLQGVGLNRIDDFAFKALSKLTSLNLNNNRLTGLTALTFSGLLSLETLIMEDNRLYELSPGTFSRAVLPSLLVLSLDRCRIYRIESQALVGLANLNKLFLAENFLEDFPELDQGLNELKLVNLSTNRIAALDESSLKISASVKQLDLDHNRIAVVRLRIGSGSALTNSSMVDLHLRHNVIADFVAEGLEQWRHLATLDLAFNALRSINASALPWGSEALAKVLVHDNPWDCESCTNSWLVSKNQVIDWEDRFSVICGDGMSASDSLLQSCDPSRPGTSPYYARTPGVVAGLVILVVVVSAAVVGFFVVVRRRQARRLRELRQAQRAVNGGRSYRQMKDLSPFSIGDDD